ncbi:MAG: thioredoxin domain-containing protein [Candidatus Kryptonium sp.]
MILMDHGIVFLKLINILTLKGNLSIFEVSMANRLIHSKSPYLRKAANQPVDWFEWCEEAFDKAQREKKPILLSIGASWCHWCHVMAKESFEKEEIARIINNNFIPIKVDRDERPDIDKRYQEVVHLISGIGGWPLTVFLTPEGVPFFGGTYFPPERRGQYPGFKEVLLKIVELWENKREEILKNASSIFNTLKSYHTQSFQGQIGSTQLKRSIHALLYSIDYEWGGIKTTPKFHHAKAFELLLYDNFFNPDSMKDKAIQVSLEAMAKGGIYDHLLGGFFRYSTDSLWRIPHFEKLLSDNAELLTTYSLAFQVYGKDLFKNICQGIVKYYKRFGSALEGGFYASQDADIEDLNEGGYYTFTEGELRNLLRPEEFSVIRRYFGITEEGNMPHNSGKNVLYIAEDIETIAQSLGINENRVKELINSAMTKMLSYREKERPQPFIDRTIYTNWNALMIESLCDYHMVFSDPWAIDMALKTAHLLLERYYNGKILYHCEDQEGYAEDYLFLAKALLSLFQITQNNFYLELSIKLTDQAIELFWDDKNGGFFDSKRKQGEGLLDLEIKNIADTPNQSVNGVASLHFIKLGALTSREKYYSLAEKNLEAFGGMITEYPLVSFSYLISLMAYLRGIFKVETKDHYKDVMGLFRPFKVVVQSDTDGIVVCDNKGCRKYENLKDLIEREEQFR